MRQLLLAILTAMNSLGELTAQADSLYLGDDRSLKKRTERRSCSPDRVPVGLLRGDAEVQFIVDTAGRADTASLRLLRVSRLSPGSAASAARRTLTGCTFRPAEIEGTRVRSSIVQRVEFREIRIKVKDGQARPSHQAVDIGSGLASRAIRDSVYLDTDSVVHEKPTKFACSQPVAVTFDRGHSAYNTILYASRRQGAKSIHFVVLPDGTVDGSTMGGDVGGTGGDLVRLVLGCRYLPGRVDGRPVHVRTSAYPSELVNAP